MIAIPLAIFLVMSSLVVEFRANTAKALALVKSIRKKKNGRASLKTKIKFNYSTYQIIASSRQNQSSGFPTKRD